MISFLRQFNQTCSDINVVKKLLSYETHSQGFRTPYAPGGVIVYKNGTTQNYSGQNKLTTDVTNGLVIEGTKLNVSSHEIIFKPFSIENFTILGKSFNREIFLGKKIVSLNLDKSLSAVRVITDATAVVNGKIVGAPLLADYLTEVELFVKEEKIEPLEIEMLKIIKELL